MLRSAMAAVYDKRKLLEGKEADAQRQQDMFQGEICMKGQIQVLNKEIIIFEIKEQSEIEQESGEQSGPVCSLRPGMGKKPAQKIVDRDADYDNSKIINVKIAIEP